MELLHSIVFDRTKGIGESSQPESSDRRPAELELMSAM
jgi:hypothetical protein